MDQLKQRKSRQRTRRTPPPPPKHPKAVGTGGTALEPTTTETAAPADDHLPEQAAEPAQENASGSPAVVESAPPVGLPSQGQKSQDAAALDPVQRLGAVLPLQATAESAQKDEPAASPRKPPSEPSDTSTAAEVLRAYSAALPLSPERFAVQGWLQARTIDEAVRELLDAVVGLGPRERDAALELIGMYEASADAALRSHRDHPLLGLWVGSVLGQDPRVAQGQAASEMWRWLQVEDIARVWQDRGAADAYTALWRRLGEPGSDTFDVLLARLLTSRHPQAAALAAELRQQHGGPTARTLPMLYRLRLELTHTRPSVWRRVVVPADATLEHLHEIVQILMGWDGASLHVFQVGDQLFTDEVDYSAKVLPEYLVRIDDAFDEAFGQRIAYIYGDRWHHEVTVEEVVEPHCTEALRPRCTAGSGVVSVPVGSGAAPSRAGEAFRPETVDARLRMVGAPRGSLESRQMDDLVVSES